MHPAMVNQRDAAVFGDLAFCRYPMDSAHVSHVEKTDDDEGGDWKKSSELWGLASAPERLKNRSISNFRRRRDSHFKSVFEGDSDASRRRDVDNESLRKEVVQECAAHLGRTFKHRHQAKRKYVDEETQAIAIERHENNALFWAQYRPVYDMRTLDHKHRHQLIDQECFRRAVSNSQMAWALDCAFQHRSKSVVHWKSRALAHLKNIAENQRATACSDDVQIPAVFCGGNVKEAKFVIAPKSTVLETLAEKKAYRKFYGND